MILTIDIGNTNVVIGLFNKDHLKDHFRISTREQMTTDEAGLMITSWLTRMKIANESIDSVIIGSVVPKLSITFEFVSKNYFGCIPVIVSHKINLPIKLEFDYPEQIGADRIANAAAGYKQLGGPVIVVDFGTATTFDIVNKGGAYIGGIIIPGPETSMAELARKAARLYEVKIEPPETVIGKSTTEALKSGLFFGTIGQVDFIIDKIIETTGFENCQVIATGGFAAGIEQYSKHISLINKTLTLEGLKLIEELN